MEGHRKYKSYNWKQGKETSLWIAQDKINFLVLSSLSTLRENFLSLGISHELVISPGKRIKHFYVFNICPEIPDQLLVYNNLKGL